MKKQLKNLTIKDNFMFAAVMLDKENCKGFLERALQIKIDHVEVCTEKNIVYHQNIKACVWTYMQKTKIIHVIM